MYAVEKSYSKYLSFDSWRYIWNCIDDRTFFIYKFIESLSPNFSSLISEMMKTCAIYLNMIWNQFDFAQLLTLRMNSLQMAMNQKFFNLIQENFYQEKVFSIVYFSVALWQQLFNGEYNGLTSKKEMVQSLFCSSYSCHDASFFYINGYTYKCYYLKWYVWNSTQLY